VHESATSIYAVAPKGSSGKMNPPNHAVLFALLICATALTQSRAQTAQYTAYDLGPGFAYGINSRGTVVGTAFGPSRSYGFKYSDGIRVELVAHSGQSLYNAYDINDDEVS